MERALGAPVGRFVGAEDAVPEAEPDAEVVMPHVVSVVEEVDRSAEPEGEVGFLVLHLMGEGGKGRIADRTQRESECGRRRDQKTRPTRPHI